MTALNTVTVRSRVDGPLVSVPFHEGQLVAAGDLLAKIDPRTFQVALDQAAGQLAHDQSQLADARVDLDRYNGLLAKDSIAKQQVDSQVYMVKQLEGTVRSDQATVENARLQLEFTRITAPFPGRVGLRQIDPGRGKAPRAGRDRRGRQAARRREGQHRAPRGAKRGRLPLGTQLTRVQGAKAATGRSPPRMARLRRDAPGRAS